MLAILSKCMTKIDLKTLLNFGLIIERATIPLGGILILIRVHWGLL